jgi:hypothetical protein
MPINHQESTDGAIKAEPIRLHEKGHGVVGVIFAAADRQATDWRDGTPLKWDDGNPIKEYVLNIAAEGGKANFSVRDEDGKPRKGADGKTILEERTFENADVCVIASGKGSYQLFKECKEARVNEGMKVRIERLTPSGNTKVDYSVEVLGEDLPLKRFDPDAPAPSGIDHGAEEREPAAAPF